MRGVFALLALLAQRISAAAIVPTAALAPSIPGNRILAAHVRPSANATAEPDDAQSTLSNVHTSILNGALDPAPGAQSPDATRPPKPTPRRPPQSPPTSRRSRRRR